MARTFRVRPQIFSMLQHAKYMMVKGVTSLPDCQSDTSTRSPEQLVKGLFFSIGMDPEDYV